MAHRCVIFVLLVLSQRADGVVLGSRTLPSSRAPVLRMDGDGPAPFSTECIHIFDATIGSGKCRLALARTSDDRRATLALWRMMYVHEAGGDEMKLARAEAELRATLSLSSGESSMTFGAYLNASSMNDGEEHAVALVRVEGDTPGKKDMIVDMLLVSPALPKEVRQPLHAVVVQSLQAIGKSESMNVRLWTDFDI